MGSRPALPPTGTSGRPATLPPRALRARPRRPRTIAGRFAEAERSERGGGGGWGAEGRSEPFEGSHVNCASPRSLDYGSLLRGACPRRIVARNSAKAPRAVRELPMTGIIAMGGILSYISYLSKSTGGEPTAAFACAGGGRAAGKSGAVRQRSWSRQPTRRVRLLARGLQTRRRG